MAREIDRSAISPYYYVHVRNDLSEVAFAEKPDDVPTIRVRLVEVTDQPHEDDGRRTPKPQRPKGQGWHLRSVRRLRSWWEREVGDLREVPVMPETKGRL